MANRDNDELAAALHGLSSGDPQEPVHDEHEAEHHPEEPAPPPVKPPAARPPAASRPASAAPANPAQQRPRAPQGAPPVARPATNASRPAAPASSRSTAASSSPPIARPAQPAAAPGATAPASPARAARPAAPAAPPAAVPVARPSRAAAPEAPPPEARVARPSTPKEVYPGEQPTGEASAAYEGETTGIEATDEDDQVIVPAAPMSSLGYGMEHRPGYGVAVPKYRQLESRRTTIPILLTCGALFLVMPVLKFVVDEESALAYLLSQVWLVAILVVAGLVMLGLGVMTMLQVRHMMDEQKTQTS